MQTHDLKYWHLHNHQLFKQLSEPEILDLCIISRYREAQKGEMIFFTGDTANRIFILKKGVVKIMQTSESGQEVCKDVIHEGDLFGHLPGTSAMQADNEYALAASDLVSICTFRKEDFEKVLQQNPQVSLKFATHIGDKLRVLEQKYNSLVFKDVKARLFDFMKQYVKTFSDSDADKTSAPNHLTQEDIAQLIGASRQTVATLIHDLEHEGYLVYSRKQIKIIHS